MKVAVCSSGPGMADKIAKNLQSKGHSTRVVKGGLKDYLDAVGKADALLVVNEGGEVSPELVVTMVLADYLGKSVMATEKPRNGALRDLLSSIDVNVIG